MEKPSEWMPVFTVLPPTSEVSIHVGDDGRVAKSTVRCGQEHWQRIGTALTRGDGSISVQLTAIPINGRLVLRPRQAGEKIDPTVGMG